MTTSGGGTAPFFVNSGTLEKTSSSESSVSVDFENQGTVDGAAGKISFASERTGVLANGSKLEGTVVFNGPSITGYDFSVPSGTLTLRSGTLTISAGSAATMGNLLMNGGTLSGAGTLTITGSLTWEEGTMSGTGTTVVPVGATAIENRAQVYLYERKLVNEGSYTIAKGFISMQYGAVIENNATFTVNAESTVLIREGGAKGSAVLFLNDGVFQKTEGLETYVEMPFDNQGIIDVSSGLIRFREPQHIESSVGWGGEEDPQEPSQCGETNRWVVSRGTTRRRRPISRSAVEGSAWT